MSKSKHASAKLNNQGGGNNLDEELLKLTKAKAQTDLEIRTIRA